MQKIIKGIGRLTAKFPPHDAIQVSYEILYATSLQNVRHSLPPIEKITANVIRMKATNGQLTPEGHYELEADGGIIHLQRLGPDWKVVSAS